MYFFYLTSHDGREAHVIAKDIYGALDRLGWNYIDVKHNVCKEFDSLVLYLKDSPYLSKNPGVSEYIGAV